MARHTLSARARSVAQLFDVRIDSDLLDAPHFPSELLDSIPLKPGTITFLTGPSGAGKSSLLRALLAHRHFDFHIDLTTIRLPDVPVVDGFDTTIESTLELLAKCGLAEVWCCFKAPDALSDGQRWRLRLAHALALASRSIPRVDEPTSPARKILIYCDEFASSLDRETACAISRALRKIIDRSSAHLTALLACAQPDLVHALAPDTTALVDFQKIQINPCTAPTTATPRSPQSPETPPATRKAAAARVPRDAPVKPSPSDAAPALCVRNSSYKSGDHRASRTRPASGDACNPGT